MSLERARRVARLRGMYAIVNEGEGNPTNVARAALDAGVHVIQYRAKRGIVAENLRAIRDASAKAGALLIVNDDWRAAIVFDCDGVHLGPGDDGFTTVANVRSLLEDRVIGLSCGTLEEAYRMAHADVDYVGVGPVFSTASKKDAGDPIGIQGLRTIATAAKVPVAAIGGITLENLKDVRASGVAMAAVISAISATRDPKGAAAALVGAWEALRA